MDRVLVKPEVAPQTTQSGFIVPTSKKDNPVSGVVVSIGESTNSRPLEGVNEGDTVFFKDMAGSEFKHDGVVYYALYFEELAGVLNA